jgi:hypothetical protein
MIYSSTLNAGLCYANTRNMLIDNAVLPSSNHETNDNHHSRLNSPPQVVASR